jgi:hypothetical protein
MAPVVQRQVIGSDGAGVPSPIIPPLGLGRPLDPSTRSSLEPRFNADFSNVRIYDNGEAHRAATQLDARAFTVGQHIAFAAGEHAPHTHGGRRLLAHELAHTVQQRSVESALPLTPRLPISSPGSANEREADRAADAVTAGARFHVRSTGIQVARQEPGPEPPTQANVDILIGFLNAKQENGVGDYDGAFRWLNGLSTDQAAAAIRGAADRGYLPLMLEHAGSAAPYDRALGALRTVEQSRASPPVQTPTPQGPGPSAPNPITTPAPVQTATGYVTYPIPVEGDQQFIFQFYRAPGSQEGALLRFKSNQDSRNPVETPISAGAAFAPTLGAQSPGRIVINLGEPGRTVEARYSAGREVAHYHAINPESPFGPLLMNREFSVRFLEALVTYPSGFEHYSFKGGLPDEAIAEPTWRPYVHPGLGFSYRAASGRYQGRSVTIDYGEVGAEQALREGMIAGAKFMAELAIFSIPYVGPLILIGQAVAGRTIWGDKLSTEGRVLMGLFALLPVVSRLGGAAASEEAAAARELATARGISESDALKLIRGLRKLSAEDRSFIQAGEAQLRAGQPLTEEQARRLAAIMNRIGGQTQLVFSAANDIDLIWQSRRYWGMTEGAVYGARLPADTFAQRLRAMISRKQGMVVFQGQAAELFHAHEVEGAYSGLKRLLGQEKAGFGDIVLDEAVKEGNTIIVTRAHIATAAEVQHAGQSTAWAAARLWGRRLTLEPVAAGGVVAAGIWVYMLYDWIAGP